MDGRTDERNQQNNLPDVYFHAVKSMVHMFAGEAAPPAWTRSLDLQDLHQATTITTKSTKVFAEPADGSTSTQLLRQQRRTKRTTPHEIKTRHFENRFRIFCHYFFHLQSPTSLKNEKPLFFSPLQDHYFQ